MPEFPIFLANLPEDDQKHIKHCANVLLKFLAACQGRLRSYQAEDAEARSDSVLKLIQQLKETHAIVEGLISELVERHRLPDDLKRASDELRKDMRDILTGNPPN